MSDNDVPPAPMSGPVEIENAIFNLVVTLVKYVSTQYGDEHSRLYVATYLERLAEGLRTVGDAETNKESKDVGQQESGRPAGWSDS